MFQFLCIFGPAAVSWLIAEKLSGSRRKEWFTEVVKLTAYAAVNTLITMFVLLPKQRVEFIIMSNNVRNIQYGKAAFLFAMGLSVVLGVLVGILKKRLDISIQIVPKNEENTSEAEDKSNE